MSGIRRKIITQNDIASINKQPNQLPEKYNSEESRQIGKILKQKTTEIKKYENGISLKPIKLNAVKNLPTPKNINNIRSPICPTKDYTKGIEKFSKETRPLINVKKKKRKFYKNSRTA